MIKRVPRVTIWEIEVVDQSSHRAKLNLREDRVNINIKLEIVVLKIITQSHKRHSTPCRDHLGLRQTANSNKRSSLTILPITGSNLRKLQLWSKSNSKKSLKVALLNLK